MNLPLLLIALASTGTPGPNNLMILSSGLNFGVSRSIPHWLGICTGVPVMVIAVGLGLDQVFHLWPWLFTVVKSVGILYLIYLTYKIATTTVTQNSNDDAQPMTYWQAVLFQWVNPKAWVMVVSAVSSFTTVQRPLIPQILEIALTFMIIGLFGVGCWLFAGDLLHKVLRNPVYQQRFNWFMASLLGLSVVPMAFV